MRYVNVFCGRYSLATGTRVIAWFYIILYLLNIILNITAVDIVESYKENVDGDIDYDKYKLLTINYISLTFGVVTVLLSAAFLIKFSESEDFVHFMVKWSIIRCFVVFVGIIYICIEMHHVLTISLSSMMISIDLCASAYFTGVMASYIKELEDPSGQVHSNQQRSNGEPSVYLISHKKSLHMENKVSYVNEVVSPATKGFEEIPLNDKHDIQTNHNLTTTNSCIKTIQKENPVSTAAIECGNPDPKFNPDLLEETEKNDSTGSCKNSGTSCSGQGGNSEPGKNASSSDMERNSDINDQNSEKLIKNESPQSDVIAASDDSDAQTECEKQERVSQKQEYNDTQLSENSSDVERLGENPTVLSEESSDENIAVNNIETEPPSVVIIPASPDEEFGLQFKKDDKGTVNLGFDTVEMK